jgi:hypothetical protein
MSLLDTRIPAGLDADGMTPDERRQFEMMRAHRAMGLVMARVPISTNLGDCTVRGGCVDILVGGLRSDHDKRAKLMLLAEQFGFEYTEQHHVGDQNMVAATGTYAGAPVKFWQLVRPCSCGCAVTA